MSKPKPPPTGRDSTAKYIRWLSHQAGSIALLAERPMALVDAAELRLAARMIADGAVYLGRVAARVEFGQLPILAATIEGVEADERAEAERLPLFADQVVELNGFTVDDPVAEVEPTAARVETHRYPDSCAGLNNLIAALPEHAPESETADEPGAGEEAERFGVTTRHSSDAPAPKREPVITRDVPASKWEGEPLLDVALRRALMEPAGAPSRWKTRREQGATDADLASALVTEWPKRNWEQESADGPAYYARSGPDSAFFLGGWAKGKKADLKGPELIAAVRRVLAIPLPREEPVKTTSASRKRRTKATEATP